MNIIKFIIEALYSIIFCITKEEEDNIYIDPSYEEYQETFQLIDIPEQDERFTQFGVGNGR